MDTNKLYFENVPARLVLYLFAFTLSMTSYFLRTVMNLTILAMVKNVNVSQGTLNNSENLCRLNRNISNKANDYGGTLEWSADAQYFVLTSFFWTYIASQLLGAIITHKFGAKLTILLSILTASVCTLFIPLASELHHLAVILLQLLNGGAQGVVWPAMYSMVGWWIPIYERTRYLTSIQGATIGTALSYFISGYIIAYFGWKYVFYFFGVIGLVWCLGWYLLIYDKPELHPRISSDELIHIIRNREQKLLLTKQKVPWKYIFSSVPLWAIAVSSFGRYWAFITTTTYGPVYLKTVVGLEVQTNGMWSSLISLASFFTTAMLSYISDKLLIYKVLSTVAIRKMFAGIGQISSGLLCILMAYLSCEINTIVAVWVLIQIFVPINALGTMVNIVDVAPNFSAAATSFIQIILLIPSILSTYVAKQFLEEGSTFESWKRIFNTSGGVLLVSYLIYFLFGSADRQKWDNEVNLESVDTEELEGLDK